MEPRIGKVFHETRTRREIELAEVEAATRIRGRFLRAIEDEEWDVLPGGVYTRGFIRTYASFLGLDGDRLAEDYRESVEGASREWAATPEAAPRSDPSPWPRRGWTAPSLGALAVLAVLAVAVVAIVAIPSGGGDGAGTAGRHDGRAGKQGGGKGAQSQPARSRGVSVRLAAGAEVWVCMLDAKGRHLVDGQILEEGAEEGPFRSGSFTVSFGNGEVSMLIDGREAQIPPSSSPLGYSIDSSGRLAALPEGERPTCT